MGRISQRLDRLFPRLAHQRLGKLAGTRAIARVERGPELLPLASRLHPAGLGGEPEPRVAQGPVGEREVGAAQQPAAARLDDHQVELVGRLHVFVGPAACQRPHRVDAHADRGDHVRVATHRDALRGDTEQRSAQLEHLVDLVDRELGYPRAPPREDLYQSVALEDPEGLADRAAADGEAVGEFLLVDPVARLQPAADDRVADDLCDLLGQRKCGGAGTGRPGEYRSGVVAGPPVVVHGGLNAPAWPLPGLRTRRRPP
jgi:hypothetical protein